MNIFMRDDTEATNIIDSNENENNNNNNVDIKSNDDGIITNENETKTKGLMIGMNSDHKNDELSDSEDSLKIQLNNNQRKKMRFRLKSGGLRRSINENNNSCNWTRLCLIIFLIIVGVILIIIGISEGISEEDSLVVILYNILYYYNK